MRTIIFASREQADAAVLRMAEDGGALGIDVQTPSSFIAAQWELWGDGRRLVAPVQRAALIADLVTAEGGLVDTPGTAAAIAAFVERACGTEGLRRALRSRSSADESDDPEQRVLDVVARYCEALRERGFVEPGEAAEMLAARALPLRVSFEGPLFVSPAIERLFRQLAQESPVSDAVDVVAPAHLRYAFAQPAGPAAGPHALLTVVDRLCAEGCQSITVCAHDPHDAFAALCEPLRERDYACALTASVPFGRTWLGRALADIHALIADDARAREAAVDLAFNPWLDIPGWQAERLDASIRGDRAMDSAAMLASLRALSDTVGALEGLIVAGDDPFADAASLSQKLEEGLLPSTIAALESEALSVLCATAEALRDIGALHRNWLTGLADVPVAQTVAARCAAPRCEIVFRSMADLRRLSRTSVDAVIIDDVSDAALCARSSVDCLGALTQLLGIQTPDRALGEVRAALNTALAAARRCFACLLPATDDDRERTWPSFAFEELLSCIVGHTVDAESAEAVMAQIDPGFRRIAEDDLVACVGRDFRPVATTLRAPVAMRGRLVQLDLLDYLRGAGQGDDRVPVLSPSALERYLHCPYAWFLENRIGARGLDEGFGPAEKGSFVHAVMARCYDMLGELSAEHAEGAVDVQTHQLLDTAFDTVLDESAHAPGRRLKALTPSEHLEVEDLRRHLHRFLDRLNRLPDTYRVLGHEMPIRPEDGLVAGVRLSGRVDRVDVDDAAKRFAVIDYKGSIAGHAAGSLGTSSEGTADELPEKMQTLIYALALRERFPGYRPAAALYASYKSTVDAGSMAGSFDIAAYDVSPFAGTACETGPFEGFLDTIESVMAHRLEPLFQGDIEPRARSARECSYCPFTACEVRL